MRPYGLSLTFATCVLISACTGGSTEAGADTRDTTATGDGDTTGAPNTGGATPTPNDTTGSDDASASGDSESGGDSESEGGPTTTGSGQCGQTMECAELADGWEGPLAVNFSPAADPRPSCGAGFTQVIYEGGFETASVEHTCACDCEEVSCGDAYFEANPSAGCLGGGIVELVSEGCFDITDFTTDDYVGTAAPPVLDEECTPDDSRAVVAPVDFVQYVIACAPEDPSGGGCGSDEVCLETPLPPFEATFCLVREGTHSCPGGTDYTERSIFYDSFTDTRSCPTCECSFSGVGCVLDGDVQLYSSSNCAGAAVGVATPGCDPAGGGGQLVSSIGVPATSGAEACVADAGTQTQQGTVTSNDPTTACCLPL